MSFKNNDLKRLHQIRESLPKDSTIINSFSSKKTSHKTHKVETERDPEKLFHELIKASPDGDIPAHLISLLKEIELESSPKIKQLSSNKLPDNLKKTEHDKTEMKDLYINFKSMLLEEEEDLEEH